MNGMHQDTYIFYCRGIMVNKYIAPGCRTGYNAESNHIKISVCHFPVEKELRRWIQRDPGQNWIPTKNSILCENHFLPSVSDDNTRGRGNKRGNLNGVISCFSLCEAVRKCSLILT